MCSQEKLSQVRWLASADSRAVQGTSGSRAPQQSQKRRSVPPPPPPPTAQSVLSRDGGSAAKGAGQKIGNNLGPVCPGGDQTGVLPPFCEATPILFISCGDCIAQAAVQTTSAVGRGFIPPNQGGRGDC